MIVSIISFTTVVHILYYALIIGNIVSQPLEIQDYKEDEMDRLCSKHGWDEKCVHHFGRKTWM